MSTLALGTFDREIECSECGFVMYEVAGMLCWDDVILDDYGGEIIPNRHECPICKELFTKERE